MLDTNTPTATDVANNAAEHKANQFRDALDMMDKCEQELGRYSDAYRTMVWLMFIRLVYKNNCDNPPSVSRELNRSRNLMARRLAPQKYRVVYNGDGVELALLKRRSERKPKKVEPAEHQYNGGIGA